MDGLVLYQEDSPARRGAQAVEKALQIPASALAAVRDRQLYDAALLVIVGSPADEGLSVGQWIVSKWEVIAGMPLILGVAGAGSVERYGQLPPYIARQIVLMPISADEDRVELSDLTTTVARFMGYLETVRTCRQTGLPPSMHPA